ncbi:MAG: Re/Si-specific NAD(P)(+) transhydrogenase subunit alpha [Planctomycetota bacterium]
MRLFVPKETTPGETRIAAIPDAVAKLVGLGLAVEVEGGVGAAIGIADAAYEKAGATVVSNREGSLEQADIVARLRPPPAEEVSRLKPGGIHVSYLDPFGTPALIKTLAEQHVTAVCMELIPRTTLAQKMDALSSQANLAGYVAVIIAAERLGKILPMMMTPAGTVAPSKVFVIGAGVAGLQAIATAKRLGARVEAFDTRPVVEEQVQSLGARFVKLDLGETGQTEDGYAKQLTEEQLARQREMLAKHCAAADVVITTAQVFGRQAPRIVTGQMLGHMQPGSVVVDMAVETGGNVEGSVMDDEVEIDGVRVIGLPNLAGRVPVHASQMYASNITNLISHFWDKESGMFRLDPSDQILNECVVTHKGEVRHENLRQLLAAEGGEG